MRGRGFEESGDERGNFVASGQQSTCEKRDIFNALRGREGAVFEHRELPF